MERQEIFNGIKEILDNNFEIDKVNFTEETHLRNDLGADSIDVVSIGVEIDQKFDIETAVGEIDEIWADLTVGYLVDLVQKKLEKKV